MSVSVHVCVCVPQVSAPEFEKQTLNHGCLCHFNSRLVGKKIHRIVLQSGQALFWEMGPLIQEIT